MIKKIFSVSFLILLSFLFFLILSISFNFFNGFKEKRLVQATYSKLTSLEPQADSFSSLIKGNVLDYWVAYDADQKPIAYIFVKEYEGYRDLMEVAVGVDLNGVIQQVEVWKQNETPGFDRLYLADSFLSQFRGKKESELNQVSLVTGATVSAQTVKHIVKEGIDRLFRNEVLIGGDAEW